jgi:hypothetical protein
MTNALAAPGWYANGGLLRWWDGTKWTEHTAQAPFRAAASGPADRAMFTEQVLVFKNKPVLIPISEFTLFDGDGRHLGNVVPRGQNVLQRACGQRLDFLDPAGRGALLLTQVKNRNAYTVERPNIGEVGTVEAPRVMVRDRYSLTVNGVQIGEVARPGGWSKGFTVRDECGEQVGTVTFGVEKANALIISHYYATVRFHARPTENLATMVAAAGPMAFRSFLSRRS